MRRNLTYILLFLCLTGLLNSSYGVEIQSNLISAVHPQPHTTNIAENTVLWIDFKQAIQSSYLSPQSLRVYGRYAGRVSGQTQINNDSTRLSFIPNDPFLAGEHVTAILTPFDNQEKKVKQRNGFVWEFDIRCHESELDFIQKEFSVASKVTSVSSIDIQDDGRTEFVFAGTDGDQPHIRIGTFENGDIILGNPFPVPDPVRPIRSGDINGDGISDVILLHRGPTTYSVEPRISIGCVSEDKEINISQTIRIVTPRSGQTEPRDAAVTDINGDGALDIVLLVRSNITPLIYILYNDGTGYFPNDKAHTHAFYNGPRAESLMAKDLNFDGTIDIAATSSTYAGGISIHLNPGNGVFGNESDVFLAHGNRDNEASIVTDFSGNGKPDIVCSNIAGENLLLALHQGVSPENNKILPVYELSEFHNVHPNTNWLIYSDFDGDGDQDLAASANHEDTFVILENGDDFPNNKIEYTIPADPINFTAGDFNADQAMDLCIADSKGQLTFLINSMKKNWPPEAPELLSPDTERFFSDSRPRLTWFSPTDRNGDFLHFGVKLTQLSSNNSVGYDSRDEPDLFTPHPPVPQDFGPVSFQPAVDLTDDTYQWSVRARDDEYWSEPSEERIFTIDTTPPENISLSFSDPDDGERWFAMSDRQSLTGNVHFNELHPDSLIVRSEIADPVFITDFQDNLAEINFSWTPDSVRDGEYTLSALLIDKVGQRDSSQTVIGLDWQPPGGTVASVTSDTSETDSFMVTWGGGSDGNGSGLSGYYQIKVSKDGGPWIVWFERTSKTGAYFDGEQNSFYRFEAAAFDNVGQLERFNGKGEATVVVIKTLNDDTPPPSPKKLVADGKNPSPWKKTPRFELSWQQPEDESDIVASFYKLGEPPQDNSDYTAKMSGQPPVAATATVEDGQWCHVWLQDAAGNVSYENHASVLLRYDKTPPVVDSLFFKDPPPAYGVGWYNQEKTPRMFLSVIFTENNIKNARVEFSQYLAPIVAEPPEGATETNFRINPQGLLDTQIDVSVEITDLAGHTGEATIQLSLDSTAPENTVATSPDSALPGLFPVSWDPDKIIETGSGLANKYSVRVKIDGEDWQLWKQNIQDTVVMYPGQNGHVYAFEASAFDNVGNQELFTGNAETVTHVYSPYADTKAPGPPIDMTVNGSEQLKWYAETEFEIDWQNPPDSSGITRYYYKWNEPPTGTSDFDGEGDASPPITVTPPDTGMHLLYLWLKDGSGNTDHQHTASQRIAYDPNPPIIDAMTLTNAIYDNRWFHPDSVGKVEIALAFGEDHLDSLNVFINNSNRNVTIPFPKSGAERDTLIHLPIQGLVDGCYQLSVILVDSAGNRAQAEEEFCIDTTPPVGTIASSPDTSIMPNFTVNWQENSGEDGEGSGISGFYDIQMQVDDGEWQLISKVRDTEYEIQGEHGHSYGFEVAARDHCGNREAFKEVAETTTIVDTGFVDKESPLAPINLGVQLNDSRHWQNTPVFNVWWINPQDRSGIQKAYYKLDGPPAHARDVTDSVSVKNDTTFINIEVTKEGRTPVYVWLKDGTGNVNFNNYNSTVLRYDATAPVIHSIFPQNPAFGTNRYDQLETPQIELSIHYEEVHADSLFITNPNLKPTAIHINSTHSDSIRAHANISQLKDGTHWLYLVMQDSAGNVSTPDSVHLELDSAPPGISYETDKSVIDENTVFSVQAEIEDNYDVQSAVVLYRQGGERQVYKIPMQKTDNLYQADIPGEAVAERGLEYQIVAEDGLHTSTMPEDSSMFSMRVNISGDEERGLVRPDKLYGGSEENAYRMLSFPLDLTESSPRKALEDDWGPYQKDVWRFFWWDAIEHEFVEFPGIESLSVGQAYWAITAKDSLQVTSGPGTTVETKQTFQIKLQPGWNDVALPFCFPIDWSDIKAASSFEEEKLHGPYTYQGSWVYPFDLPTLFPWQGYSFYAEAQNITLNIPALESQQSLAKKSPLPFTQNADWAVQIVATYGSAVDSSNIFGCSQSAKNDWDPAFDYPEAPEIGNYVSLYFPHPEWSPKIRNFSTDFKMTGSGNEWEFCVACWDTDGEVKLDFHPLSPLPEDMQLRLLDQEASVNIDLRNDSTYTFWLSEEQYIRHFKIFSGDSKYFKDNQKEFKDKLDKFQLVQNYPNPFNSSTVISYQLKENTEINLAVYNLLAQKVKQLRSGFQEKGFYQLRWDGVADDGRLLGTGVYILRLETPNHTSTCKMIFMR